MENEPERETELLFEGRLDSEKEELKQVVENTKKYHLLCGKLSEFRSSMWINLRLQEKTEYDLISDLFRWAGRSVGKAFKEGEACQIVLAPRASKKLVSMEYIPSQKELKKLSENRNGQGIRWASSQAELLGKVNARKERAADARAD